MTPSANDLNLMKIERFHLYSVEDVLRPRGSMQKESLSLDIYRRLILIFESWSNGGYADALPFKELKDRILANLREEVDAAIEAFVAGNET